MRKNIITHYQNILRVSISVIMEMEKSFSSKLRNAGGQSPLSPAQCLIWKEKEESHNNSLIAAKHENAWEGHLTHDFNVFVATDLLLKLCNAIFYFTSPQIRIKIK